MESKSLIIRTKNRLTRLVLPNTDCNELDCDESYNIWDVLSDCFGLSFIVFFILILPCGAFGWPIPILTVTNIVPVVLLVDYLRRKDTSKSGKTIAILSLAANLFLAISLATDRWDWFMGLF